MDCGDELYFEHETQRPYDPNTMDCDEHLCPHKMYSCGDGQCVHWETRLAFQRLYSARDDCFNKRNLNYMCEVSRNRPAWTLESGLCCPEKNYNDWRYPPWSEIDSSKLTQDEVCQYLVRCLFSDGFEHDCPCTHQNCSSMIWGLCRGNLSVVPYPSHGLINANMFFFYHHSDLMNNENVNIFALGGSLRCR
ncbi:unnamed protein product [Rotaria socialis]|uniref:Uncharacterized protein n=1 Tax=Rotaria socialis TaxID=392032 RepID=A0A819VZX6_9BILA|nr:unnamed protein product [Rotaria socialis]CAF3341795.1 unnamed protein product [Rotaria socialis]CAF4116399.1 unnamed protein product [Rotaria socialis]CAF4264906.1 unnamed protein product [Rotaria socialis]CAF4510491.1 unnamed protein product [Rotaria socialis]